MSKLTRNTSMKRAKELAEGVLAQLEEVAAHGLDKVYENHFEWACDLSADLPWDEKGRKAAFIWLTKQPRLKAASDVILARGGPDYFTMFQDGLNADPGAQTKNDKDFRWRNRK